MTEKIVTFSYDKTLGCVSSIIHQMWHHSYCPDVIVGISRGGIMPAMYIHQWFDGSTTDIDLLIHNKDEINFGSLRRYVRSKTLKLLIVDDINDTGATLDSTIHGIHQTRLEQCWDNTQGFDIDIRTAALVDNVGSAHRLTYAGTEIDKVSNPCWVAFPWEDWWLK